ncbi:MAG: uroporphyrinogen-III synthase [Proteobacteria bacterium]|nr:uroporphyrinogen-III synthase [Pseudomonadota bacterium]
MPANNLAGLRVLVTRPAEQAAPLLEKLTAAGARPLGFPLLILRACHDPDLKRVLAQLTDYAMAIFISPGAVRFGLRALGTTSLPPGLNLATVGKGTARALEAELGHPADICPNSQFDSAGLLAEPALHDVAGQRILIFRGRGGREQLADSLRHRGARVDYAEVYERCQPDTDSGPLETALREHGIDVIIITSREALDNLMRLLPEGLLTPVRQIPVLVIHPRQAGAVRRHGFVPTPILAHDGSDGAIIEALLAWKNRHD